MAKKTESTGCDTCHWSGFVITDSASYARAELCSCIEECPHCEGSGNILSENENGYSYVAPCHSCGVIRRNVKLYNIAGIPAKYSHVLQVDAGLELKRMNSSLQRALKYAKDEFVKKYPTKDGFLLMGPSGLGKTHLAVGTISELTLKHGVKCLFKDFFYLLSDLKQAYSEGTPENDVILPLIEADVLVIDELGKGRSNEWELNILDQLISKRYNASKKTLITTNFVTYDLAKEIGDNHEILEVRVGERIASRLHEMCEFLYLQGRDYRKERKKAQNSQ
ncbi:MAG: ATP-binding protein [Thermodesulfobacteriota bacterium]|nr:ATP-binding protein [Candidatus Dadabacteria bacterium]MCZ6555387.1 ATP-binding protein [Candidatus Dadabacteria bacterium]MCZ6638646.1 ATP-binding protein [Candidatus Dadabacteria bacterium]MCZ6685648.1 ATP-binding protein [Candidatus Dadabacteria bacterium]MCZ6791491.1 ATP-binding protein [Candidatus Dadabacteria bacterium]